MNAALPLLDSPAWTVAGWSLLHYLWIGAALGVVAWLLKRAVRPLSPQARYAVALATFAALAVAPPLVVWRVATQRAHAPLATVGPISAETADHAPLADSAQAQLAAAPALPPQMLAPAQSIAPPVETIDAFLVRHGSRVLEVAVRWAPAIWLFGMPLAFAFLATGLFGAERLRQRSSLLADGPIADAVRRWAEVLKISRTVAVGMSDRIVAPLVIGVLRPMIVLPASIVARQSPEQMEMILLHELSHVRRADNLVNLIQRVVEAVLFFQPAVWFVSRWVRLEREHCCDNMVLSYTGDPQGYAETLASLAMPGISPAYAAAAMANHQLVSRIQHILSREEQTMSLSPKIAAVAGAICLVVGLSISGAAQQASPPENLAAENSAMVNRSASEQTATTGDNVAAIDIGSAEQPYSASIGAVLEDVSGTIDADKFVITNSDVGLSDSISFSANLVAGNRPGEKRPWGPEQATGAPDVPNAGDDARAWASLTQDDQDEWLDLKYAEPVEIIAVQIFANHFPGAVSRVTVFDADTAGLQYMWEGKDPVKASGPYARGVSIITIPASIKTNRVRIELASKSVAGWNEIDAVGLLDATGKTHWATEAAASSTYAERPTTVTRAVQGDIVEYRHAIALAQLAQEESATAKLLERLATQRRNTARDVRDWSPDQATGAPADLTVADVNDRRHAWRPAQPDAGRETLHVFYSEPVKAKLLLVYELGEPGVVDIVCRDAHGTELRVLSERNAKSAAAGVLSVPLEGKLAISSIALGIDTAAKPGWTDIDAVGLIDDQGKVHWADRAHATSTHGDVADRASRSSRVQARWLQDHGQQTNNASCQSCHKDTSGYDAGGDRPRQRVPVKELLDKSDSELREWLKRHGAANIHIDANGEATVEGTTLKSFFKSAPEKQVAPVVNEGSQSATEGGTGTDPNATTGDAVLVDRSGSMAPTAFDVMDSKLNAPAEAAKLRDANLRAEYYQRVFDAQSHAIAAQQPGPNAGSDGATISSWLDVLKSAEAPEQVQIALAVGERGYFSRPGREIVGALTDGTGGKDVFSVSVTDGGLLFVGMEPGSGRVRCWDANRGAIELKVTVEAKPSPRGQAAPRQQGDPKANKNRFDGHQRIEDWTAAANAVAATEQVQILLAAGERGYFSRPNRKIVRAERVETPDAKNVLSITITSDGLEFVGSEPGAGLLRCWDQNGQMIEVSVRVDARKTPLGDPTRDPKANAKPQPLKPMPGGPAAPDPRDASQNDAAAAVDRFIMNVLDRPAAAVVTDGKADARTVARRAYLDLFGIAPTAEQIDRFVGDGSEETLARSFRELAEQAAAGEEKR